MAAAEGVEAHNHDDVASVAAVSDGNHFTISADFVEDGIPYFRGQDVVGNFFIEQADPYFITPEAFNRPYMTRSHLEKGDVLLSIVGTVGELSLVATDEPATCSCKLAILRPRAVQPEFLAVVLRSTLGRLQIERLTRGAVQTGLILEDMDQLLVPRFGSLLEGKIVETVLSSQEAERDSYRWAKTAEENLYRSLGLDGWVPTTPLSSPTQASLVKSAGRMDAEYFAPKIQDLINRLGRKGISLGDVAPSRREKFKPCTEGEFDYIEIGSLNGDGTARSTRLNQAEAPSRAG